MEPFSDPFPFDSVLSFELLIEHWRRLADEGGPRAWLAERLLADLEAAPDLTRPIESRDVLDRHRELVDVLFSAVLPLSPPDDAIVGAITPFKMEAAYATPAFQRLITAACGPVHPFNLTQREMMLAKAMRGYYGVLETFYHVSAPLAYEHPLIFSAPDPATELDAFYKVAIDTRFVKIRRRGKLPSLEAAQIQRLLDAPLDLELWMELLPPEHFVFEGFGLISAVDVTEQETLSMLKNDLLQKDAMATPERIDLLERRLQTLLRQPDLRLGLIALSRGQFDAIESAQPMGRSLLMEHGAVPVCPLRKRSIYAQAFEDHRSVVVPDVEAHEPLTGLEYALLDQGVRNLMVAPLRLDDELIGLLELGAPEPGTLNAFKARMMDEVLTLFTTAMKRSQEEREDRLQAVIKRQFTALHPVVEWRFRDAAFSVLEQQAAGGPATLPPIVFEDVYPLYALADVRDSSVHRNAAIQSDLTEQLGLALMVIIEATTYRHMPVLDELGYRIEEAVQAMQEGLGTSDEVNVLQFLRTEVEPLFDHLARFGPRVEERVQQYRAAIDPDLGFLYRRRAEFEASMTAINDRVAGILDREEAHAQAMFPHYFEKYKTDGVDYNMFVGASLVPDGKFDKLYLRNLRLWQLMIHCQIAWEHEELKPTLPIPLDIAQLVLVQDLPLAIRFRLDEKRFDVDGAYNIRYEIIKKRIDKAYVRGTDERLTQPGRLAIVYSQDHEAVEYRQYLRYLRAAGYVDGAVEELALQDLQGVQGLRALRIEVAPHPPDGKYVHGPERLVRAAGQMAASSRVTS